MKNKILINIILIFVIIILCGCVNENKRKKTNNKINFNKEASIKNVKQDATKLKDDIIIIMDNYDTYVNNEIGGNFFYFNIISKKEIGEKDIKISMDTTLPYNFAFFSQNNNMVNNENDIQFETFQMYNSMDWKKMYEISKESSSNNFDKYKELYNEEYTDMNKKCDFFYYTAQINIDIRQMKEDTTISEIIFNYKGKEYVKKINLKLYNKLPGIGNRKYSDDIISMESFGFDDVMIYPSKEGLIPVEDNTFVANQDIELTNIEILSNGNVKLKEAYISIVDDKSYEQKWNGNIKISKGTKFKIKMIAQDDNFKNKLSYGIKIRPVIEFNCNGEKCSTYYEASYRTKPLADEAYAYYVDGIDVLSYYYDYYNKVN